MTDINIPQFTPELAALYGTAVEQQILSIVMDKVAVLAAENNNLTNDDLDAVTEMVKVRIGISQHDGYGELQGQ